MSPTLSRRKTQRKDCLLVARAYVDGQPAISCAVRDVTPDGAKLVTQATIASRKILLFIPAIGEVWAALIRWRRGDTFGIQFVHGEADLPNVEAVSEPSEPGAFALGLQVAQVKQSAQRLSKSQPQNARTR